MLKSSLGDYSDASILVSETISATNTKVQDTDANDNNIKVVLKDYALFTDCINEVNNTQVDNAKILDVVIPMYNLIEYNDKFYGNTIEMSYLLIMILVLLIYLLITYVNHNSNSLQFKQKAVIQTGTSGRKKVNIVVPFKYISNFWRTPNAFN